MCYRKVNSCGTRQVKKLQPLQNRAIRIVKKLTGYVSTAEMNELDVKMNLKMLCDRRKIFMIFMRIK